MHVIRLLSADGSWSSQALPEANGGWAAIIRPGGPQVTGIAQGTAVVVPDDALGIIVVNDGQAIHVGAPGIRAFKNADASPVLPIAMLHAQDRMTYFAGAADPVRIWYLRQNPRPAEEALCGYCKTAIGSNDPAVTCACGDVVHESCRRHGAGLCPRCGAVLPAPDQVDTWRPAGFPERTEQTDAW